MLPHLFIPRKSPTLVPKFSVEDLPLGRTAALVLSLQWKPAFGQEHCDDDDEINVTILNMEGEQFTLALSRVEDVDIFNHKKQIASSMAVTYIQDFYQR